ncbi:hypothetical protein BGW36DRAFT_400048 [Talaromyces proteolyticus]|uniref:Uncharacterized protein n=1 Tax=Talaromyces proteolyticus TaxID=1131652 RepID=A0AAD4PVX2_9EURO|nr:uncharacterized protein BGW36DRAFT_400048 [Talaromyces proteolyticus]KAH8691888.1 hypothetical protein BGW36DRAFT_400048 [Talaromyces proteolyticus]
MLPRIRGRAVLVSSLALLIVFSLTLIQDPVLRRIMPQTPTLESNGVSESTSTPFKASESPPYKIRIPGKPMNFKITGFVFYGRRDRVESMHCYVERNLVTNGGWLDDVIWIANTENSADLSFLNEILARSPLYKAHRLEKTVWWPDYAKLWRLVERGTIYVKIDDDIVWFANDAIERIVQTKIEHPEAFAVSANIINNPPLSFMHYHMGALHPYFPDIPEGFDLNIPWRPSAYPNWTGPSDFEWSLDYMPPPSPPITLTYEVWGPTYESWAIASQQHYSLLENIENDQLDLYKFNLQWDMKGERIRMNFLAILGDDVLDTDPFNWPSNQGDEDMLILKLPHDLGRPILIEGTALAAHFNYMHQGGVTTTDLLERYTSLAAEEVCLMSIAS